MRWRMGLATPNNQEPITKNRSSVDSRSPAQSVTRESLSGPGHDADAGWPWWLEVNPIDGETCAQPWSNLGMVDLDHASAKRLGGGSLGRHYCSACQVTFVTPPAEDPVCWSCEQPPDDAWGKRAHSVDPGNDAARRAIPPARRPAPRSAP